MPFIADIVFFLNLTCVDETATPVAASVLTMTYTDLEKYFGSAAKAADFLGMKRQSVSIWKARGGRIPFEAQFRIQQATKGRLKAVLPTREAKPGAA